VKQISSFFIPAFFCIAVFILFGFRKPQQGKDLKASMERGKIVYGQICVACHGIDGGGMPRMNPPLWNTSYVLGDKKALVKIILKGLKGGEVEIEGDRFENAMPAQESMLNDQQVADVLTYVRNSFGNKASSVSVAEVKSVRAKLAGK
jgi:mono/diheme cytochrome c family protein